MLSEEEVKRKLYEGARTFSKDVYTKKYDKAVYEYEAARNVAMFLEFPEEEIIKLFGTRQTEQPVIGLYDEELALKAQLECILKNSTMREITMAEKRRREAEWRRGLDG